MSGECYRVIVIPAHVQHAKFVDFVEQGPCHTSLYSAPDICYFLWEQDFFQVLRPGVQLLRPPKKDERDGPGIVAGFVAFNYDAFKEEYGIEPWQVAICFHSIAKSAFCGTTLQMGIMKNEQESVRGLRLCGRHVTRRALQLMRGALMQWTHVLALMGDTSDNVPGVKGIGAKSAVALIQQYGTIQAVLENASEVSFCCSWSATCIQIVPSVSQVPMYTAYSSKINAVDEQVPVMMRHT